MSKILVTGGLGFIGSNLVDKLIEQGHEDITVIDNLISASSSETYKREGVRYLIEDIRNIQEIFKDEKFDIIYHLAALARIQPSFEKPVETIDIDSFCTAKVCEYARSCGAKIVYAGSSSFYAGPHLNPYAFAKWQGEEICKLYSKCFDLSTAITRFFNVYGPRHPQEGPYATVVGIFEKQYQKGQPLTITGDGEQRRDFAFVGDICSGLIAASKGEWRGEIFNLGTGTNYSINELANMFYENKKYIPKRPGEALITMADISFTMEKTGWKPVQDLQSYIEEFKNEVK